MKTAIIKIILHLLSDEKIRHRIFLILASVIVGILGMLVMPMVVIYTMGQMEPPKITISEEEILSGLDADRLTAMESGGQEIANHLSARGLRHQIMKAQLIYLSCFDEDDELNFDEYTGYFSIGDDAMLIGCLNDVYGLAIDYDEFERTYLWIKQLTIDSYLFTNTNTRNAADLAAWSRNAYESKWLYAPGGHGELGAAEQRRTADNVGLILGYFNYDFAGKAFGSGIDTLVYTEQGCMDTMPDVPGIGVYNGSEFGVYGSNGEVFFASGDGRFVQKSSATDVRWTSWVTFVGIEYPQSLWEYIDEMNAPPETEPTEQGEDI